MNQWQRDCLEFQTRFQPGQVRGLPCRLDPDLVELRVKLIREESRELIEALEQGAPLPVIIKEMIDLIYVVLGTAIAMGINLNLYWREVHSSNMDKSGGGYRADGKVLKPSGWTPPDLAAILRDQGPLTGS